jgi:PIN domain nuclease of toxin-antitoxin system
MIVAVADTHTAVWYLFNNPKLSAAARRAIDDALKDGNQVAVSAITLAEMVYLVEKGRIPSTAVSEIIRGLSDPEYPLQEVPVDGTIADRMQFIPRAEVPEMPDRIIAATGLRLGVPIISRDRKIRAALLDTIW